MSDLEKNPKSIFSIFAIFHVSERFLGLFLRFYCFFVHFPKNEIWVFFPGRSYEPEIMKFGGKRLQTLKKGTRNLLLGVDQMLTILGGNSEKWV